MARARLALILCLLCAGPLRAEEGAKPALEPLLEEQRFPEAYEAARNDPAGAAAGVSRLSRDLLAEAARSDDNYVRWFALRAMRSLEDAQLAAAVRPLAKSDDRYVQALTLEFLANADPKGSRDVFVAALDSPYRTIRLRALTGLERLKDPTLTGRLGTVVANDDDAEIRAFAARVLGATGSKLAAPVLRPALDDEVDLVREEAVRALVAIGDERVVETVKRRLAEAPPLERLRVIRLAAQVPDPSLIESLGPFLADGDPEVRAFAAGAILTIERRAAGAK